MRNLLLPVPLISLCLVPAAGASAETLGVLSLAAPPGPSPSLAELADRVQATIAARTATVPPENLRWRMGGAPRDGSLGELDRAYGGALAAHAAGDFEGSARTLRAVFETLGQWPPGPEAHAQWVRAALRLARAEQSTGRGTEALAILDRLLAVDPSVRPEPRQYPPSFLRLVEESRARVAAKGTRRLTVEGEVGVEVLLEGRPVGTAPLGLDLAPGRYRVAGRRGPVRVPPVPVDLTGDVSVRLDAEQAAALCPEHGPGLCLPEEDRLRRLVAASAFLGLHRVIAVSVREEPGTSHLDALLVDVRRGSAEREGRLRLPGGALPPGGAEALADFLLAGTPSPLVMDGRAHPPPPAPAPAPASGTAAAPTAGAVARTPAAPTATAPAPAAPPSRALGWTATVLGTASLAAAGIAIQQGVAATRRYDEASAMLNGAGTGVRAPYTVRQFNDRIRDGDRARSYAIGMGVGAGAALLGSAALGYLSWKQTGEVGPFRF